MSAGKRISHHAEVAGKRRRRRRREGGRMEEGRIREDSERGSGK